MVEVDGTSWLPPPLPALPDAAPLVVEDLFRGFFQGVASSRKKTHAGTVAPLFRHGIANAVTTVEVAVMTRRMI